ncbi:MAG: hypothetical protein AVDCRST_MAG67-3222 [uncultured Solirubrobacteraceae bacterium]|uniref:Uncharacterized protein n=1 Tax=uncultured Solirubrobacteraceae bacterium TaxID=1162706 RepID=A0A6J4TB87_9ACTN|nr:MAG: hypothetical protein AVDCRST_MAG67-3222 [uncultured Solirubrobacteraceae bacterium]
MVIGADDATRARAVSDHDHRCSTSRTRAPVLRRGKRSSRGGGHQRLPVDVRLWNAAGSA